MQAAPAVLAPTGGFWEEDQAVVGPTETFERMKSRPWSGRSAHRVGLQGANQEPYAWPARLNQNTSGI